MFDGKLKKENAALREMLGNSDQQVALASQENQRLYAQIRELRAELDTARATQAVLERIASIGDALDNAAGSLDAIALAIADGTKGMARATASVAHATERRARAAATEVEIYKDEVAKK